jgi:hypothetical protein
MGNFTCSCLSSEDVKDWNFSTCQKAQNPFFSLQALAIFKIWTYNLIEIKSFLRIYLLHDYMVKKKKKKKAHLLQLHSTSGFIKGYAKTNPVIIE